MFRKMTVFVKTVDCGSFTAAGEVLGMAPSSVSRQINQLEEELKVCLLTRSTRHLQLTPEGQLYYDRASRLLAEVDDIHESLKSRREAISGELNVSVLETFGRLYICPILPEFMRRHPGLRIELDLNNRMIDLYKDCFDLAIRIGVPSDSRLKVRPLVHNEMVICAAPDYLRRHGTPQQPDDLRRHNCLLLNRSRQVNYWCLQKGDETLRIPVDGSLSSRGGEPLVEAARQGLGVTMLARWMVQTDFDSGRLVPLFNDWQAGLWEGGVRTVYATFVKEKANSPNLRSFLDFLVERMPAPFRL